MILKSNVYFIKRLLSFSICSVHKRRARPIFDWLSIFILQKRFINLLLERFRCKVRVQTRHYKLRMKL